MAYDKHMFAIWGAPGGGKTTMAVNMAVLLADSGYMTCLVSGTDHGELQAFFGTAIPKGKGLYAAISNGRNVRESLTEARPNLCILELDTGGDSFDVADITTEQVTHMLADLRDQFSYVIVDCTSHKESTFTGMGLAESDKVIVCIPHRVSAATWHIANSQMLEAIAPKTFYVDVNTREGGCNMDQLLAGIDLPECDIKLGCVDSAYLCENISKPIVLQGGKAEKKYKKALLDLVKYIIDVEEDEKAARKRNKRLKRGNADPVQTAATPADGDEAKKGLFGRVKKRPQDGLDIKKPSKRQQKKMETEAMRRAKAEAKAAEYDGDDDEDDDD